MMQFQPPPPSPVMAAFRDLLQPFEDVLPLAGLGLLIVLWILNARRQRSHRGARKLSVRVGQSRPVNVASTPAKISALERAYARPFRPKPLTNKKEAKVRTFLKEECALATTALDVMAQSPLREFIATDDKYTRGGGHYALGERRVDFTIVDRMGHVLAAIEYNGSGHYQSNFQVRDDTKRAILAKAGIPLIVIKEGDTPPMQRAILRQTLEAAGVTFKTAAPAANAYDAKPEMNSAP